MPPLGGTGLQAGIRGYVVSLWAGYSQAEMGSFRHFFIFRHTGLVLILDGVDISAISLFCISCGRYDIYYFLEHDSTLMGGVKKQQ
jgi:hypothetical protein